MGYSGPADLIQGTARVAVTCSLSISVARSSALTEWRGWFEDPSPQYAIEPGEAVLELPDGRAGDVIIRALEVGSGRGEFIGSGPPPS